MTSYLVFMTKNVHGAELDVILQRMATTFVRACCFLGFGPSSESCRKKVSAICSIVTPA